MIFVHRLSPPILHFVAALYAEEGERKGRRLDRLVDEAYEGAKSDIRYEDVPLVHAVEDIKLPARLVSDKEYAK